MIVAILGIYFSAMFKKAGELKAIQDGFDEIKRQNQIITEDTAKIKSQIEEGTIEFQIKLTKFHERKIEAIDLIYKRLAGVYNETRKVLLYNKDEKFDVFYLAVENFRDTLESNKIWLDSGICNEIESFAILVDKQVRNYQGSLNCAKSPGLSPNLVEKTFDTQEDFYKFTVNESKKLKDKLEDVLRNYLSPHVKA